MSNTNIIPFNSAEDTVKPTPSSMDDPSAHVFLIYIMFIVNISCFCPKRYIRSEYLNVVDFAIFSSFEKWVIPVRSKSTLHHISKMIWCLRFLRKNNKLVLYCLDVSDLIEYGYIGSENVLVSASCDDVILISFFC